MTDKEIINNEKYHTCGRCKHENTPDNKYPCIACIYGTDHRTDLWELKQPSEYEYEHEVVKAYNDGQAFILDKIRSDIERLTITEGGDDYTRKMAELFTLKVKVLQIIDKYRGE